MIYTDRDKLTVIELDGKIDEISFDLLARVILEKPSNMIYCVTKTNQLLGIISMGDIAKAGRAGIRYVKINKNFTCILKNEYTKARELFCKKKSINALPIVGKNRILLGDYTRWDDLKCELSYLWRKSIEWFCQQYNCVYLVYPCAYFDEKKEVFETFKDYLLSHGITVNCIEHGEIINFLEKSNWILFVDENEFRAMDTLYTYIWSKDLKGINFYTYREFIRECRYETEGILRNIKENGVYVFNLVWERNFKNSEYIQRLDEDIVKKYATIGERVNNRLSPALYREFFDDEYSDEYVNCITNINYQVETSSGCGKLRDCNGKGYNVVNGERYTYGQPENYSRTLYFVGACYVYGHYSEDKNTIESFLQEFINTAGFKVKVVNGGSPAYSSCENVELLLARILTLPLRKGDVVIYGNRNFRNISKINLMDVCYKYRVSAEWMIDHPMHCNHRLHFIYAEAVYDMLKPILQEEVENQSVILDIDRDYIKAMYMERYFESFNPFIYNKVGSVVMNCNPFTYGHRYLIDQALEKVDFLIIFVVEEEGSLFSFKERFAMVNEGTADLNNVMVVPSGQFILSKTTFPEYFIKAADKYLVENIKNDIKIFAEKIAGCLNIRYRFVGEEPEDIVTNEYNMAMKEILPEYGIELVEIARKESDGQYISATYVRKCLEEYNLEKLRKLVPVSTMKLLSLPAIENH